LKFHRCRKGNKERVNAFYKLFSYENRYFLRSEIMKKTLFILMGLLLISLMVACASSGSKGTTTTTTTTTTVKTTTTTPTTATTGRKANSRIPEFVRNYMKNAPDDALVGVGTANMGNLNRSMQLARQRARAEISRQMIAMIQDMVTDYTAGSEDDRSAGMSFMENISVSLSKSTLKGSAPVDEDEDERGNYWSVVMLSRANTVEEINQAVSAAKRAVPKMAALDAQERMQAAFDAQYAREIGFADKD
jgi:hypothetical protein